MNRQHESDLRKALDRERSINQILQDELANRPVFHELKTFTAQRGETAEPGEIFAELVHEDKIVLSPEAKTAVLAVALRLEERADKRTLPNGNALCIVEALYERSGILKDLLGEITDTDEEEAQELLQELIGSR